MLNTNLKVLKTNLSSQNVANRSSYLTDQPDEIEKNVTEDETNIYDIRPNVYSLHPNRAIYKNINERHGDRTSPINRSRHRNEIYLRQSHQAVHLNEQLFRLHWINSTLSNLS